jgi:arylformamidase
MSLGMLAAQPIFLHYTKAELDRNFDQRGWIPNAEAIIARHIERSRRTREKLTFIPNLRYGEHPDEVLDFFPAARKDAPIQVFVHGGAWKNFGKDDYSFPAEGFVPAGFNTVILNFSKLPHVRLPVMVDQVRRGVAWVYKNAERYGGDPNRLYMSAHSSGAHLTANALLADWSTLDCPPDAVKAAACVSGPYDLEPVMLSARSSYVTLNKAEMVALSVTRHTERIPCPVVVAYADGDTDEFQRQSREFANAVERSGRLAGCKRLSGLNHFEIMEQFGEPNGELVRFILVHLGRLKA